MRVAISGMGIAGPALAHWLLRFGHDVTLVERAPRFRAGGYIVDFWGVGYDVAERMGILGQIRDAGYSVRRVQLVDERGRRNGGFSTDALRSVTKGRFTSLPRGDLARAIYGTVSARAESLFDESITSIDDRRDCVLVSFEKAPPRAFDLVVGADGLHSNVRRLVFGADRTYERQLGYYVAAFEVAGYRPRDELVYVAYGLPGRQVARFALRGDRTLLLFVFTSDRLPADLPQNLPGYKAALQAVFRDAGWECPQILRALEGAREVYFDTVSQIRMDCWSKGRVVLLGDAAACVSLLAGEGSGLALTGAYVLAGELASAANHSEAFARYEQRLRAFIAGKQESAHRFASSFAPRTSLGIWFRAQVLKMMSVPGVAYLFIGRDLRDDFELPHYRL